VLRELIFVPVRYHHDAWFPQEKAVFQLLILPVEILKLGLAINIGSVSVYEVFAGFHELPFHVITCPVFAPFRAISRGFHIVQLQESLVVVDTRLSLLLKVFQSIGLRAQVVELFAILIPNNPDPELYVRGFVTERELRFILLLKVFQSVEDTYQFVEVFACEILKSPEPLL
jgi:hypothetical protein